MNGKGATVASWPGDRPAVPKRPFSAGTYTSAQALPRVIRHDLVSGGSASDICQDSGGFDEYPAFLEEVLAKYPS